MTNFEKALNEFTFRRIEQSNLLIAESKDYKDVLSKTDELFNTLMELLPEKEADLLQEHSDLINALPLLYSQKVYEVAFFDGIKFATGMGVIDNARN
ncbi:hypothetical protein SD231_000942 [Listeria monocytogenes]|nr:hypothetical protein [Listeria monocytogenes]